MNAEIHVKLFWWVRLAAEVAGIAASIEAGNRTVSEVENDQLALVNPFDVLAETDLDPVDGLAGHVLCAEYGGA